MWHCVPQSQTAGRSAHSLSSSLRCPRCRPVLPESDSGGSARDWRPIQRAATLAAPDRWSNASQRSFTPALRGARTNIRSHAKAGSAPAPVRRQFQVTVAAIRAIKPRGENPLTIALLAAFVDDRVLRLSPDPVVLTCGHQKSLPLYGRSPAGYPRYERPVCCRCRHSPPPAVPADISIFPTRRLRDPYMWRPFARPAFPASPRHGTRLPATPAA